jgi:hypothetical protein
MQGVVGVLQHYYAEVKQATMNGLLVAETKLRGKLPAIRAVNGNFPLHLHRRAIFAVARASRLPFVQSLSSAVHGRAKLLRCRRSMRYDSIAPSSCPTQR